MKTVRTLALALGCIIAGAAPSYAGFFSSLFSTNSGVNRGTQQPGTVGFSMTYTATGMANDWVPNPDGIVRWTMAVAQISATTGVFDLEGSWDGGTTAVPLATLQPAGASASVVSYNNAAYAPAPLVRGKLRTANSSPVFTLSVTGYQPQGGQP